MVKELTKYYEELFSFVNYYEIGLDLKGLDILENCKSFIANSLTKGEKVDCELVYSIDSIPPERIQHIVSLWVWGNLLFEHSNKIKNCVTRFLSNTLLYGIDKSVEKRFSYIWLIACLFHDLGYSIELGFIRNEFNEENIQLPKRAFNGKGIPKVFSKDLIRKYDRYRECRWGIKDHGIYGGMSYYHGMCKLRREKNKYSSLYWGEEMEDIYAYIAWVIICHNVYTGKKNDLCYKCKGLEQLIINVNKPLIQLEKHPLLFLFCLADSLEPLKIVKSVDKFHGIGINFEDNIIEFELSGLCESISNEYKKRIDDLKGWLCSQNNNGLIIRPI